MSHRQVLTVVAAAAGAAALLALLVVPWSEPLYFHLDSAREWLATGRITDHHAVGYALLLGCASWAGDAGIATLHAGLQVAIAVLAVQVLAAVGLPPRARLVGALPVALHPLFVANVTKISDTNLAVVLLLAIVLLLVTVRRHGTSLSRLAMATALLAAVLLVRPNLALLFGLLPWLDRRPLTRRASWAGVAAVGLTLALAVNAWTTGAWRLSDPYYVAYTFHNGTNPHAAESILRDTIGEYSTYRALDEAGVDYITTPREELTGQLWRLGLDFIRDHPGAWLRLVAVKGLNLVRPYYVGGDPWRYGGAAVVLHTLAALPLPLWLAVRWRARHRFGPRDALLAPWIVPLYVLPFLLLNSEPRYRWPLDAVLILEIAVLWLSTAPADPGGEVDARN